MTNAIAPIFDNENGEVKISGRQLEAQRLAERARKKRENQIPKDPQRLVNAVQAARELGISYGQYSAVRRGLLRV